VSYDDRQSYDNRTRESVRGSTGSPAWLSWGAEAKGGRERPSARRLRRQRGGEKDAEWMDQASVHLYGFTCVYVDVSVKVCVNEVGRHKGIPMCICVC